MLRSDTTDFDAGAVGWRLAGGSAPAKGGEK